MSIDGSPYAYSQFLPQDKVAEFAQVIGSSFMIDINIDHLIPVVDTHCTIDKDTRSCWRKGVA